MIDLERSVVDLIDNDIVSGKMDPDLLLEEIKNTINQSLAPQREELERLNADLTALLVKHSAIITGDIRLWQKNRQYKLECGRFVPVYGQADSEDNIMIGDDDGI
jgi:hypothetical protein